MRSKNVNGVSDWSAAEDIETPAAAGSGGELGIPRNLRAVDDTDTDEDAVVPGIKLTWSGVSGATGYVIMRWDNDDSWDDVELPTGADDLKEVVDNRAFTVLAGIVADTSYYFIIRAVNDIDTSDWSDPVAGSTNAVAPGPPTALVATPRGESTIWLSWTPATVDVGAPTSYTIRYRIGTSSTLRTITVAG